jgi:hypothetical protein
MCAPCNVQLSVRHILADYLRYAVGYERFCVPCTVSGMQGDDLNPEFSLFTSHWHHPRFITLLHESIPHCE